MAMAEHNSLSRLTFSPTTNCSSSLALPSPSPPPPPPPPPPRHRHHHHRHEHQLVRALRSLLNSLLCTTVDVVNTNVEDKAERSSSKSWPANTNTSSSSSEGIRSSSRRRRRRGGGRRRRSGRQAVTQCPGESQHSSSSISLHSLSPQLPPPPTAKTSALSCTTSATTTTSTTTTTSAATTSATTTSASIGGGGRYRTRSFSSIDSLVSRNANVAVAPAIASCRPPAPHLVTGTLFGTRKGRMQLAIQDNAMALPGDRSKKCGSSPNPNPNPNPSHNPNPNPNPNPSHNPNPNPNPNPCPCPRLPAAAAAAAVAAAAAAPSLSSSPLMMLLDLAIQTSQLIVQMANGPVRIALECTTHPHRVITSAASSDRIPPPPPAGGVLGRAMKSRSYGGSSYLSTISMGRSSNLQELMVAEDHGAAGRAQSGRRQAEGRRCEQLQLVEEPTWIMYCNGRKLGVANGRPPAHADLQVLSVMQAVSMGAGILPPARVGGPQKDGLAHKEGDDDDILYIRSRFERVIGSNNCEAFYMMNPDGHGGPEISILLLRI